jgi:hypothetical protein
VPETIVDYAGCGEVLLFAPEGSFEGIGIGLVAVHRIVRRDARTAWPEGKKP